MNKDRKNGKETQNEKKRNQQNPHGCKRERERESKRIEKTCSVFDAENGFDEKKIININNASVKLDNIGLGYVRIAKCYQCVVEVFIQRKCTQKQMQDKDKQRKKMKKSMKQQKRKTNIIKRKIREERKKQ